MAYNKDLALRIRELLKYYKEEFTKKRMFGGLAFLHHGKMTIGIVKDDLAVRVIPKKMEIELAKKHTRPMDFTKRSMKEFIYVALSGLIAEEQLLYYIELGLEHAKSKL